MKEFLFTKKSTLIIWLILFAFPFAAFSRTTLAGERESWIDSAIAEGVSKIRHAEDIRSGKYLPTEWDRLNHVNLASSYIVIDLAKWTPTLVANQFYYEKKNSPQFQITGANEFRIWDSLTTYEITYGERSDFVAYYNIVLRNFPLELRKDISTVQTSEGQNLYTQLQKLGAIQTQDYQESLDKFRLIIDNICVLAQTNFEYGKIVCFSSANFLGQYGNKSFMRASFGAYYVTHAGFAIEYPWLADLVRIPKYMCPPMEDLEKPTLPEKNFKIALAVKHFIQCNAYNDCTLNGQEFSNQYAAWLFDNLKYTASIDKPLLLSTCMKLNQLSTSMAWSVLTADYEHDFASYTSTPLGTLYAFYNNTTLNTISAYTRQIIRGEQQFVHNPEINRDSALYYGRFLYRIPSIMQSIGTTQRVKLLKTIAASSCNDIMVSTDAGDYENHCERICKALYQKLIPGEERNFLEQLKSTGAIWDLSYRLDNATFGFFGSDNYTDFIFTISTYWKVAYPEKSNPSTGSNIKFSVFKWESSFFNNNGWITPHHSSNSILSTTIYRQGFSPLSAPTYNTVYFDIYDPVMLHPIEGALIPDLSGVKDLVIPAIFLDWLSHKKMLDDISTGTQVALSALALATGIGEFYTAASVTMRVISIVEIAVSASDLILLNENIKQSIVGLFPNQQEGQEFLDAYMNVTMAINIAVVGKGLLTNLESDISKFSTKFDQQEQSIKTLLGETSPEFMGMKKLRGELGTANAIETVIHSVSFEDFANTVAEFRNGANSALAQQSYSLWKEQSWTTLEQLFNTNNINGGWPPFNGAISIKSSKLPVGKEIDRYGGWIDNAGFHDNGFFASPVEVPFEQRALPQAAFSNPHKKYRVLVEFEVEEGQIIPWFNQPGMGIQYKFSETIDKLKEFGYIEEIP